MNSNARADTLTTRDGVEIFYKDWGSGQPLVFSHGWPRSVDDWDPQMSFFLGHGFRVIAHNRRGHGRSTQTDRARRTSRLDIRADSGRGSESSRR
jgi:non-heme chloroperoxidase